MDKDFIIQDKNFKKTLNKIKKKNVSLPNRKQILKEIIAGYFLKIIIDELMTTTKNSLNYEN